jgi:murein DD-endopeptidase MepM/ murein hydrolase activator NlpD
MTRTRRRSGRLIPAFVGCFAAGMLIGWWLRGGPPAPAVSLADEPPSIVAVAAKSPAQSTGATAPRANDAVATIGKANEGAVDALRQRGLQLPIDNADVERLKGMFGESRGGNRAHEAVDILAPRNTPIHAVEDGTIEKLFTSKAGGLTIYQFDPGNRFCYYYAHLESYASGLHGGQRVSRGEIIGYVGTSGNAPPNTPHLHFAIFELGPDKRWWEGKPIDPYLVLR